MSEGRFTNGFLLGAIVGGLIVFLWGTKTGKNILKIISEEGVEGLGNLIEEYGLDESLEDEDINGSSQDEETEPSYVETSEEQEKPELPKKHFFKRIKK